MGMMTWVCGFSGHPHYCEVKELLRGGGNSAGNGARRRKVIPDTVHIQLWRSALGGTYQ